MYKIIFKAMTITAVSMLAEFMVTVMTLICMSWTLLKYNWSVELNILAMTVACLLTTGIVIATAIICVKDKFTIDGDPV